MLLLAFAARRRFAFSRRYASLMLFADVAATLMPPAAFSAAMPLRHASPP